MLNLAELMTQMQNPQGLNALAGQFGLSPGQTQSAMEALLPAFAIGLNQATQTPAAMAQLFGTFAGHQAMTEAIQNPLGAGPTVMSAGQEVMKSIFGSSELTQAVAQQAATVSGVGQEAMKQIMPMMASMIMGALMKGAMSGQNPLGSILSSALGQMATPASAPGSLDGPMGMLNAMLGGLFGRSAAPAPAAPTIPGFEALTKLAQDMKAANPFLNGGKIQSDDREASGARTLGQQAADTWTATFGHMFEHGRELQDQQLQQIEHLFAQFGAKPKG